MTCSRCGETGADYFSTNGDPICKRCFSLGEIRAQEIRGIESTVGLETTGEEKDLGARVLAAQSDAALGKSLANTVVLLGILLLFLGYTIGSAAAGILGLLVLIGGLHLRFGKR